MNTLITALIGILFLSICGFNQINTGVISMNCIEGNGKELKQARKTGHFSALHVDGAFNVKVLCGQPKTKLNITGDSNIVPHVATEVKGETLSIYAKKSICSKIPIMVSIEVVDLNMLILEGANDIFVSEINNAEIRVTLDGTGDINLSGKTDGLKVDLHGAGNLHAKDLKANEVSITANDSTGAEVHAVRKLHAISRDVGKIRYFGNPQDIEIDVSDVGEVGKIGKEIGENIGERIEKQIEEDIGKWL